MSFSIPAGNIYSASSALVGGNPAMAAQGGAVPIISRPISTTRILLLSNFSAELKTRDLLAVFQEWEDMSGGFRIKWVDDRSAYIVFQDPLVAKKAFLATLSNMPAALCGSLENPEQPVAKLLPYTGSDVDSILSSVANRPRSRSISQAPTNGQGANGRRLSSSGGPSGMHNRRTSMTSGVKFQNGPAPISGRLHSRSESVDAQGEEGQRNKLDMDASRRFVQGALGTSGEVKASDMSKEESEAIA